MDSILPTGNNDAISAVDGRDELEGVGGLVDGEGKVSSDQYLRRVLVVESDGTLRRVLNMVLREHGFEVDISTDCFAAAQHALTGRFDAFIIDYGVDGKYVPSFVRFLRERFPAAVIIGMSGHQDGTAIDSREIDLFMNKPLEFGKLVHALNGRNATA